MSKIKLIVISYVSHFDCVRYIDISQSKYRFVLENFKLHRSTPVYGCTCFNLTAGYLFDNFILNYVINDRNLRYLGTYIFIYYIPY